MLNIIIDEGVQTTVKKSLVDSKNVYVIDRKLSLKTFYVS